MGQQISLRDFEIPDLFATNNQQSDDALSTNETEDVHLFLPQNIINEINKNSISLSNKNNSNELSITNETLINQIRNDISVFSNLSGVNQFNTKMSQIIKEILDYIAKRNTSLQNSIQLITDKQKHLQNSYVEKLKDDENEMTSIFSEKASNEEHIEELSFFAVQSLITMLLMLLKSANKSDSTIVHRMLNLTNQLVEQIPLNSFSSDVYQSSHNLFKSLKPLKSYIEDLSIQTDINPILANQSIKILFYFSVLKSSFKDILPLIRKFIFNTNDIFDIRTLFVKLNKHLTMMIDQFEKKKQTISQNTTQDQNRTEARTGISLDMEEKFLDAVKYLQSIQAYPNTQLIKLNEKKFSGQFICSILLVHIDLHNQFHVKSKFERNSLNGSFSFELDTKTFKYLYEIIEQLTTLSDTNLDYILNVCLRLFKTHLQFLIDTNFDNFQEFLNENDIDKWFTLILKLSFQDKLEASQTLIDLIEKQILSFGNLLIFIHQHIIENQHPILIDQLLNKLNQEIFIFKWIKILCNNQNTEDRTSAYTVLHSFIDIVFKSIDNDKVNRLYEILITFQELIFVYLNNQLNDISDEFQLSPLSTLIIEYTTHIIKYGLQQNILFEPILLGLSTLTEFQFNFTIIQPIFTGLMPLFAEYVLQTNIDTGSKTYYLISWLLGKMSHRLIVGPSENELEKQSNKLLKSPLFSGGYETLIKDINPYLSNLFQSNLSIYTKFILPFRRQESILDNDLLISIYRNIDQGEKLISKMKLFTRNKYFVYKSIEDLTNETCAAVFSVYIKHYRRIDLAQYELMQPIEQKPHPKLLMLYEYANNEVRRIFANAKGRDEDYYELSQRIKNDALLLIVSIRESSFISKIKEDYLSPNTINKKLQFQRQKSHWTKAKFILRLLRHTLNACIRFKYFILEKKRAIQNKQDSESIMHRAISKFLYGENSKFKIGSNQIIQCLIRQYQRAMTRFITYSFIQQFINSSQKINRYSNILFLNLNDNNHLNWHYLNNIQASNNQLKEDIGRIYYKIIKNILSFSTEYLNVKIFHVFNMINLNYDSLDLGFLNEFEIIQELFINFNENVDFKLTSFNWFRLVTLKLCENIQLEFLRNMNIGNRKFHQILEQQIYFIFDKLILKQFKENQLTCQHLSSFKNLSFIRSSNNDINICLDQYLILLLRCIHFYEHIRLHCATIDFIQQLFYLSETNQSLITRLLSLKILRDLLIHVPDGVYRSYIKNTLTKILFSIGQNFNLLEKEKIHLEIIIEFISIYRQILSNNSPWQKFATELLINGIQSGMNIDLKSLETVELQQLNVFIASLCILGGYVRPYCLGSTVEIYSIDELQFGIIIEINRDILQSDSSDVKPYLVQYVTTNQTEWISSNQIRIVLDIHTLNLLILPMDNTVHTILDTLGFIAEKLDTSTIDSLLLLDIKYRVVKTFYEILNSKQIIEIFMDKPYASIIPKLSTLIDQFHRKPNDLRLFNRLHLEQYYLSLDRYTTKNQIIENKSNQMEIVRDSIILEYLSETNWMDQDWKPIASKNEINAYKKGRLGNDDIRIVCLPVNDNISVFEECGIKHKFEGRVRINDSVGAIQYRTFIPDGIQLNEGKWYFCVRFPGGGVARVGWATTRFNPSIHDNYGLGDNQYSWSYNGEKPVYEENPFTFSRDDSWNEEAVCGCGIEINGLNTNIKYWLNGTFVDTIYSHTDNETIKSKVKTNLLPNGILANYFPGVTVKLNRNRNNKGVFEFIFSPEDMTECPLPKGYKPLLMPKLLTMENVLVPYPYSAYLIGNDVQQYFERKRCSNNDSNILRDFVNNQHFQVPFNADMIKTDDFRLSLDNHQELTISFDFEIIPTENRPDELDIALFKFDDTRFSIKICIDESNLNRQHVTILFEINEQTKVYINNKLQILNYYHSFDPKINYKLNLQLLPDLNVGIRNLGIWKYLLSEEHIQRLFTYGISYVAIDYQRLKAHQKRFNTIQFKAEQKYFNDETLVPLNQPFQQDLWEETKRSIKHDESNFFKTIPNTNQSVIQLFGNKTYLILDTANQVWSEYTLILDISLPNFPSARLTLLSLDDESEIYITQDGHLHVTEENQSSSPIKSQEYIRLLISVQEHSIYIYIHDCLEFDVSITENQFATKLKHIDLFREFDLTKNPTNDDQLRIQCRSITYLNKSFSSIKNYTLDQLILPPFDILSTSLIGIGYKEESIAHVIKKYNTANIYSMDKILREENKNIYEQKQQQKRSHVLQRLNSYDENGILNMVLDNHNITINSEIDKHEVDDDDIPSDQKWFYHTVRSVGIHDKLDNWLQDNQLTTEDPGQKLLELTKADSDERDLNKTMSISSHYTHREVPSESYVDLRTTCEYGLITMYAHHTILRMLKVWYNNDQLNLFPLMKFGDADFIVKLFRSMYSFAHTNIDRMDRLIKSMVIVELEDLLKCIVNEKLTIELLNKKAPIFSQFQKQVVQESIEFFLEPSLIDEQIFIDFILKIFRLFFEVFKDFQGKTNDIDLLIRLIFPDIIIKILFDLFLWVPLHQSKIFILGVFTKLIQTSEHFQLHKDIQNFLEHMFIEVSGNKPYSNGLALKFFRRFLVLFELTLMEREKQLVSPINEWPGFVKDLAIVLDLSSTFTNKTKPCQLFELILIESEEITSQKSTLTKEIVETAQTYFDTTADLQVMKFMNQNIKLDGDLNLKRVITDFIKKLPAESIPDTTKYASFTCLCNIPSICVRARIELLYLFNVFLAGTLSTIDFSVPSGLGFIVDRIRSVRHYILFLRKFQIFNEVLTKSAVKSSSSEMNVEFDILKASIGERPEDTMFYQAYKQLKSDASTIFRREKDDKAWNTIYVGMHSTDLGGPYRDSVTRICADLCSTRLSLFILCPNGRTETDLNRDRWIPNVFPPNRSLPVDIKNQYRFVGQLMGMAIRTKQYVDLRFPILLWKQLIYEEITIEDIQSIDTSSFVMINEMQENIQKNKSLHPDNDGDYLIDSIMDEVTFDVVSSTGQTYELVPGGSQIQLTAANFEDYCNRYRQYRLKEFSRQIEYIRQGLYSVVPSGYLTLFTAQELEELVCGKGYIDIQMLKRHTRYENDNESSPHIQLFWSVLSDMFTEEQKKLFLIFVWGRSTLPYTDQDFTKKFRIARLRTRGNIDQALPTSSTCAFTLHLPAHSTKEIMYERLNYAMTYCPGIDADGDMN